MSLFKAVKYDLKAAESELNQFEAWLKTAGFAKETIILDRFKQYPNLPCLLAPIGQIKAPNLEKWELGLQGLYKTDLALGHDGLRQFLLIEFEGAEEHSLFGRKGTAQSRNWSPQLEHGFGQVIDWACLLSETKYQSVIQANFGGKISKCSFLVICGRDDGIQGALEEARLDFRREKISIEGIQCQVLTYDQMVRSMQDCLELWKTAL